MPPLIEAAPASRVVRARDLLLTLGAWALTIVLLRNALRILWDFLRPPVFRFTIAPPSWEIVLGIVLRYRLGLELLALWVLGWALLFSVRRRDVSRHSATPPLVSRAELAASTGVPEATLAAMEGVQLLEVSVGERARIATVTACAAPKVIA